MNTYYVLGLSWVVVGGIEGMERFTGHPPDGSGRNHKNHEIIGDQAQHFPWQPFKTDVALIVQ